MVSLTEKNFSSNSAFVISISTYTRVTFLDMIGVYGTVELFLMSIPVILVIFDGG